MKADRVVAAVIVILLLLGAVAGLVVVGGAEPEGGVRPDEDADSERRTRRHATPDEPAPVTVPEPRVAPPPPKLPAPFPPGRGRLQGVLVDAVDGDPVAGARVEVLELTGFPVAETETDAAGRYVLEQLPDGRPLVARVTSARHLTGLFGDVALPADATLRKDARLMRPPEVRVRLEDADGAPVPDGSITIRSGGAGTFGAGHVIGTARADEDGRARLGVPGFGEYELLMGSEGIGYLPAEVLRFDPGSGDREITRRVYASGRVVAVVLGPDGTPAAGAYVTLAGEGVTARVGASDREGEVEFESVAPRTALTLTAHLEAEALRGRTQVRIPAGGERRSVIQLVATTAIGGRVLSGDAPVAGATVTIRLPGGVIEQSTATDAEGRFTVDAVGADEARVVVEHWNHGTREAVLSAGDEMPVELDIVLERQAPAALRGRVVDEAGDPVADAVVYLSPATLTKAVDADGRFTFTDLWTFRTHSAHASATGFARAEPGFGRSADFVPRAGTTLEVELVLRPDPDSAERSRVTAREDEEGLTVVGIVRTTSARPVPGAVVSAGDRRTTTDGAGAFALRGVASEATAATPVISIAPPPGLLKRHRRPLLPADGGGAVDLGVIELHSRPVALLRIVPPGEAAPDQPVVAVIAAEQADTTLGRLSAPGDSQLVVTYDGVWPYLPPRDAWSVGATRIWAGVAGEHGMAVAEAVWTPLDDQVATVLLELGDALSAARVRVPKAYVGGRLVLSMDAPDTATDSPSPEVLRAGLPRGFAVRVTEESVELTDLPRGRWSARLVPPRGRPLEPLETTFDVDGEGALVTFKVEPPPR